MAPEPHIVAPGGRLRECAAVERMLADTVDGSRGLLLVRGDAGIGKTTLVEYAVASARGQGFRVLEGSCLDLSTQVPFAPVLEALRPLLDEKPNALKRPATAAVAELVRAGMRTGPLPHGQLLGMLREVVDEAARDERVMLVLEDMHWAEPTTRDFALTVARGLPARTMLVLTYRSDDLHRRHPFRSTLMELARAAGCVRVEVGPLDHSGLAALVERRTGARADPASVRALLARSEGNPLFAEELVAAPDAETVVPPALADLLLARVDTLRDPVREMLRAAAVGGSRIDADLVAALTGCAPEEVAAGLREACDANVLVQRAGRLEFRHALLREAVYDDLLPGERTRLHGRYAAALQQRGEDVDGDALTRATQLAHHWYEAKNLSAAFAASVRASRLARPYGPVESVAHLERALDLWDQIPNAEARAGMARAEMLRLAAEGHEWGLGRGRALALMREAIAALGPDPDPLLAARVYTSYAGFWDGIGDEAGERDAVEQALRYTEGTASKERARALHVKSRMAMRDGRSREGLALARRSLEVARAAGHHAAESEAVFHVAVAQFDCGDLATGLATLRDCLAMPGDTVVGHLEALSTLAFCELVAGHPEKALELAREGVETARSAGLRSLQFGPAEQLVQTLTWTGELDPARQLLDELIADGMAGDSPSLLRSDLLLSQGDVAGALAAEEQYLLATKDLPLDVTEPFDVLRQVALFTASGDERRAVEAADRYARAAAAGESPIYQAGTCLSGYVALLAAQESDVPVPRDLASVLDAMMATLAAGDSSPWRDSAPWAWLHTARAYRQRLMGARDPAAWEAAVGSWRRIGYAYSAVAESVHLVEDLLAAGDHERAARLITDSWNEARAMGAEAVVSSLEALARQARVHLNRSVKPLPAPLRRLTPRELEVLDLLATGATNRAIAETLFISEKTVSVHVSNLMGKLGVSHRADAAALAEQR
ncbi:MAG: helix-turn-helix transcriptional regulator [Nocardioidaceae bacterium]